MPGWQRPKASSYPFQMSEPTLDQLKAAVACKKSKCAPGINAIPYLVYNKCPPILKFLLQIVKRVWRKRIIPANWQRGAIILIPKSSTTDLADPKAQWGGLHPTQLVVLETLKLPASTLKDLEAFQPTKHIHMINYDDSFNPMWK